MDQHFAGMWSWYWTGPNPQTPGYEQYVTEVGSMNLFVFWKNREGQAELITAPLDGTILPGFFTALLPL